MSKKPSVPSPSAIPSYHDEIVIVGARQHNLKNVNLTLQKRSFSVITGPSGSGKSSLAFDTIYTEGRRRYVESLSAYARQFLNIQEKPDFDSISGLSPSIAIDQKTTSKNPRSTVATTTEIYDYLRLLFARVGTVYSPSTGLAITNHNISQMIEEVCAIPEGGDVLLMSPVKAQVIPQALRNLKKNGFARMELDGKLSTIDDLIMQSSKLTSKNIINVVVDRVTIDSEIRDRVASSVETIVKLSEGTMIVRLLSLPDKKKNAMIGIYKTNLGEAAIMSEKFVCHDSGFTIDEMEPRIFSFNSNYGECQTCHGIGTEYYFAPELIVLDPSLSIREGAILPWKNASLKFNLSKLKSIQDEYKFSIDEPFETINEKAKKIIFYGIPNRQIAFTIDDGNRSITREDSFNGVINDLSEKWKSADSDAIREELQQFQDITKCHSCFGYRLKSESLCVKIDGKHIGEVSDMTIADAIVWFGRLSSVLTKNQNIVADRIIKEIIKRMTFLNDVGLPYLSLSRESGTLSGGESQRIRLASQIGSELTGVTYILDEPSIGLHQADNEKLIKTIKHLRDIGNTVIVVEHDEDTIESADYVVDFGPGAGVFGGYIIAQGTPEEIRQNPESITGQYLSGKQMIDLGGRARRKIGNGQFIEIKNASGNNLKNINVKIPLGMFVAVTGVSGCGKSTLVMDTLYPAIAQRINKTKEKPSPYESMTGLENIEKVIEIDQSPIGRTPRSNPATYTACFNHIRDWFSNLPESRKRGYKPARFSFNVKSGRCETCQGDGVVKVEMHFLPDVYVPCDICKGKRYNNETLEIHYKGKSISDVIEMSIDDALQFFENVPLIKEKLQYLSDVGLGYMKLGQSATTLSGGESQRIKLAKELSRRTSGSCLYILDEPTTGLHSHDIKKLLDVLHRLIDQGNSMIVIEHNMDVIKTSDYVIDMGPEGGINGGQIIAKGTPEEVSEVKTSITGRYLKKYLAKMQEYRKNQKK